MTAPRRPPKLDLRAFQSAPAPTRRTVPLALLDTHLHLWTAAQLDSGLVKWPAESGPAQLSGPHTLEDYHQITTDGLKSVGGGKPHFTGVVYVQAEAEHDDLDSDGSKGGWDASIDEVDRVCKAALEKPDAKVVAIVPWTPLHHGATAVSSFLNRVLALPSVAALAAHLGYPPIRSMRYLLQSSPRGFFLTDGFISGLKELGRRGIAFDLTLDVRNEENGGLQVLDDAQEMIAKVRDGQAAGEETVFILDHFSKPSLADSIFSTPTRHSPFHTAYLTSLYALALLPSVYLKLSGFLDFAPPELIRGAFEDFKRKEKGRESKYGTLRERVGSYLEPAVEAFGTGKILVGSDWPMFRPHLFPASHTSPSAPASSAADEAAAWAFEMQLYLDCCTSLGLEGDDLDAIFAGNARRVYKLGRE
ncbi:hypothetical protein JCM10207_009084 [Rhodosporidiobolus poonsookiae]